MLTQKHIEKLEAIIDDIPGNAREVLSEIFDDVTIVYKQKVILLDGLHKLSSFLDECDNSVFFNEMKKIVSETIKSIKIPNIEK